MMMSNNTSYYFSSYHMPTLGIGGFSYMIPYTSSLKIDLLKYNLHALYFTYSKCTIQWLSVSFNHHHSQF